MKVLKQSADYRNYHDSSVVTIGVFDGIHRGHQLIIQDCVKEAKRLGLPSVALTFERNPREVVCGEHPCFIADPRRKLRTLSALGIDYVISTRFTKRFASITPEEFCKKLLVKHLGAKMVCVGSNFHFGSGGAGDVEMLERVGKRLGFGLHAIPLVTIEQLGQISSTLIRGMVSEGRIQDVLIGLGRPYAIRGKVIEGHGRGRSLGFPTANIMLDRDYCVPPYGVYAGNAIVRKNRYVCAINIGTNPTFGDQDVSLEVHLLEFDGDLYGKNVEVEFLHRLRDERTFAGPEELVRQMNRDVARIRELLEQDVM